MRNGGGGEGEPVVDRWWGREALLLDFETNPGSGALLKIGAVLGEETLSLNRVPDSTRALKRLGELASRATCVVGHNILEHDIPVVAAIEPGHPLCGLPVIDTLFLSPLAFPENPYHRLVKDYKLVSEARNDPVADARLSAQLLGDEAASLMGLMRADVAAWEILRALMGGGGEPDPSFLGRGLDLFFSRLPGGEPASADFDLVEALRQWLPRYACGVAARHVDVSDLGDESSRHAVAYCVAWLRVAGANSVLPAWVRRRYPLVGQLLHLLRDVDCGDSRCRYCAETHNPEKQLKAVFGFDGFRPTPSNESGGSLQRDIVAAGMRDESLLAILPTGGGKSICFQLPALVRYQRRGSLTIVISPLQALMKDQIDGLVRRTGSSAVAALYGLLTPPERGDVLNRITYGDIALLYVSPEQLRNRSFERAIRTREIGCWVFDEAHCLSKWGHDFRPDYLYAGRFIREFARRTGGTIPPVACFTATAKQDVTTEICDFFRRSTNTVLRLYQGGVERDNLRFRVEMVPSAQKFARIDELLHAHLDVGGGAGVVFLATRAASACVAEWLRSRGWAVEAFHAGLKAPEKKRIQDAFLAGEVRVICATNAFGMGIDKDDVRVVIHGDTPGSLENYLQEAGRAGRDRDPADCVLLYDDEDCEKQFRLGAASRLSRHDIAQLLRGLRNATRRQKSDEVVLTTGELLRDDDLSTSLQPDGYGSDTKVRAAVAWLERAGFIERNENRTNVFQARLLVRSMQDARERVEALPLTPREEALWLAVVRELLNTDASDGVTADDIARLPEFASYMACSDRATQAGSTVREASVEYLTSKVFRTLEAMSQAGILKKDTVLSAFIRYKVNDHSLIRFQRVMALERAMLALMQEQDPDPEGWVVLDLRQMNHRLRSEGNDGSEISILAGILKSISMDGRGFAGSVGSIELRPVAQGLYRARIKRAWHEIAELIGRRHQVSAIIMGLLYDGVPSQTRPSASVLREFHFEEIAHAIRQDALLSEATKDLHAAIERSLMYLHEQKVIILQQGLAVFRSAMTINVLPEAARSRYTKEHYLPLADHYGERVFQVHVMREYARFGAAKIREALDLVVDYFRLDRHAFIDRYFKGRTEELERATTAESYRRIVEDLGNRDQQRIVQAPVGQNMLVLAGPGSGKTRTVVHRCAYLLRVQRVSPRAILVCCFNRNAAVELRRRLYDLVGSDARAVSVHTYHGLAMRLLGLSYRNLCELGDDGCADLDRVIVDAAALLRGDTHVGGLESDELRERLLAGYEHILVDEYQDIDEPQYEMISAIAGRTLQDEDAKLSLMAVGDDDQNIYTFRGANVRFIRRFEEDYAAESHYLVENYRSTRYIIEASNKLIACNRDRMKTAHPININTARQLEPAGGVYGQRDTRSGGRVLLLQVSDAMAQAAAVVERIMELRRLNPDAPWSGFAVLSRTRRELNDIRTLCDMRGVPVNWLSSHKQMPPLHRFQEVYTALEELAEQRDAVMEPDAIRERLPAGGSPWADLLVLSVEEWLEMTGAQLPVSQLVEYLYESLSEQKRECCFGDGVSLRTIHTAKGMEYPHVVVVGDWYHATKELEDERRVLYVAMTRAIETLTIVTCNNGSFPFARELHGPALMSASFDGAVPPFPRLTYHALGLADMFLDFAGSQPATARVHQLLASLRVGDLLEVRAVGTAVRLFAVGVPVAQLSKVAAATYAPQLASIRSCRVLGLYVRKRSDVADPSYADRIRSELWHIPICEFVCSSP